MLSAGKVIRSGWTAVVDFWGVQGVLLNIVDEPVAPGDYISITSARSAHSVSGPERSRCTSALQDD